MAHIFRGGSQNVPASLFMHKTFLKSKGKTFSFFLYSTLMSSKHKGVKSTIIAAFVACSKNMVQLRFKKCVCDSAPLSQMIRSVACET